MPKRAKSNALAPRPTSSQLLFQVPRQRRVLERTQRSQCNAAHEDPDEVDPTAVSVAEAAKLAKCSDDTIRRRLRAGKLAGASQEGPGDSAPWRIPVSALIEEGLCDASVLDQLDERLNPTVARLANQVVDLRAELTSERTRREAAERLYDTSQGEVEYLRRTLDRLLTLTTGTSSKGGL